jgi:hypothetical protein
MNGHNVEVESLKGFQKMDIKAINTVLADIDLALPALPRPLCLNRFELPLVTIF